MTIISVKIYLSKLVTRTWGSAPPPYIIYTKGNGKEIYTPEVIFYSRCKQRAAYGFFLRASIENVYLVFSAPSKHDRLNIWKSFV